LWRRASSCLDWPGTQDTDSPAALSGVTKLLKRAIDLSLTILGGALLLPFLLIIALLIKLSSPGPVIFRQRRVGYRGKEFVCWKFRTMVCNGDEVLADYLARDAEARELWNRDHKLRRDPRVTSIGKLLRKTSLDELPQLWNVIRGEMSLVGPRPIVPAEIPDFGSSFKAFCSVLPGITGLWQVSGRNHTTYSEHVELDKFYAENYSLWLDIYILILTIKVVLFRQGAY
jgi:Undecaprenyl-phosphate galactose phosphotransferase WbaP